MDSYRLCSLGRFLQWAITATGGLTKRKDPKGSLRKMLDRLADERQVDPASYEKILDHIKNTADTYTAGFDNHWLSGNMWRDAISAYQYLTVKLVLVRRNPESAAQILFAEVLSWFGRSLLHWYREGNNIPEAYKDNFLWFTHIGEGGDAIGFKHTIGRLRSSLLGSDSGSLEFARMILTVEGRPLNDDSIRDQAKQLKEWEAGVHFPEAMRIKDLCSLWQVSNTKNARYNIHPNRIRRAADDLLEGFYVSTFVRSIASLSSSFGINPDQVPHPHDRFVHVTVRDGKILLNDSPWVLESVPSRFRMDALYRNRYVQDIVQQPLDSVGHVAYGEYSDHGRFEEILDILPEASDEDTLLLLNDVNGIDDRSAYCNGPLFADAIRCISFWCNTLDNEAERNRLQKGVYQRMHLHGLLQSSYQDSESWRKAQRAAADQAQLLPDDYYLKDSPQIVTALINIFTERHVSQAEKAKIRKWRKDRVDEWIRNRPYRRTRLMIAVSLGMTDTAIKLINDGADPCLMSFSYGNKRGDNGTAFIFAVQTFKAAYLHGKAGDVTELWRVLRHMAKHANKLEICINTPTLLKNYTCLGEAISSTDPELVQWLIGLGASVEVPTGSDEQSPAYLALNELFVRAARRNWGLTAFLRYAANHSGLNMQRMGPLASTSSFDEEQFRTMQIKMLDDPLMSALSAKAMITLMPQSDGDEGRLLYILSELLENGAEPDSVQKNGFTPLGFCREISEIDNIGLRAAEILKSHGASKILP